MLLSTYTSTWLEDFEKIKHKLDIALYGLRFHIEHVGSTSIPELDAKPIIDLDIIYTAQVDFATIKLQLERIGYYHNGNQGIKDRDVFKRSGQTTDEVLDAIPHHLYVCPAHSQALERHLLSRDFLRKHKWARQEYQRMKYELAEKANQDRKIYAELKEVYINGFIDVILEKEKIERIQKGA